MSEEKPRKERKTKAGKFLQRVGDVFPEMVEVGASLLDGTPVGAVLDVTQNVLKRKAEKDETAAALLRELEQDRMAMEMEYVKLAIADTADARATNVQLQNSSASWLAKNASYIIDMCITALFMFTVVVILLKAFKVEAVSNVDMSLVNLVLVAAASQMGIVLNFHRGSSQGSKDKEKLLEKIK